MLRDSTQSLTSPRSCYPFYIVTYFIKWITTSWTYSTCKKKEKIHNWAFFCFLNYCLMEIRNPVNYCTNFADFYVKKEREKSEIESAFHTDFTLFSSSRSSSICLAPKLCFHVTKKTLFQTL